MSTTETIRQDDVNQRFAEAAEQDQKFHERVTPAERSRHKYPPGDPRRRKPRARNERAAT